MPLLWLLHFGYFCVIAAAAADADDDNSSSFIYYSDLRLHCSHIYLQTNVHSKYAQPIWAYKSLHTLFMSRHETPQ